MNSVAGHNIGRPQWDVGREVCFEPAFCGQNRRNKSVPMEWQRDRPVGLYRTRGTAPALQPQQGDAVEANQPRIQATFLVRALGCVRERRKKGFY